MEEKRHLRFLHAVESNNKRAAKSGAIANLTVEEFETAYIYFSGKCVYSGQDFTNESGISIEHIIPILSGGHSMAFNCIPVSCKYNSSKSGYHLLDWWKYQTDEFGNSVYNPLRLLKLLNYMIKSLESIGVEDPTVHVLEDNEIDQFLRENKPNKQEKPSNATVRGGFRKLNQLEVLRKMDMVSMEDLYSVYSELDNLMLNVAIFFEETVYELEGTIPKKVLDYVQNRIKNLPDIYIGEKKVFKKEMNPEDIKIRQQVLHWAEKEGLENKYGIIGYMNFEVLKHQADICDFLDRRKQRILQKMGATPDDFNNVVNKVPNILTDLGIENRISDLASGFELSTEKSNGKSSELYRYVVNKPDLLIAGENMSILLKYVRRLNIDKRLLKKGVPISMIVDNIEMAEELLNRADLDVDEETKKRILDKFINSMAGSSLRDAYRTFRKTVREKNENLTVEEAKKEAARWIICISEKFNSSEILKEKRMNATKGLYDNMSFNDEGFMVGVNPNAYIVPKIISMANLDISREAEAELINNVFFVNQIRQGIRADRIQRDLAIVLKKDNPNMADDEVIEKAARWFVFLSESSQVHLGVMFDKKSKDKYIEITKKYYENMQFDGKGNFIDQEMPELSDFAVGIDYMKIADSYFKSTGDYYIIKGSYIPKKEIQEILCEKLLKCKTKKAVKSTCIRMLKDLSEKEGNSRDR